MQTPALLPLSQTHVSLLGKTCIYYDATGTKPSRKEQLFEQAEYSLIKGFEYKVDLDLLRRKLRTWHDSMVYGIRFIWHGDRQLVATLKPALQEVNRLLDILAKQLPPEKAGEITEEISVYMLAVKPNTTSSRAFMTWFKVNNLVDDFRCRYSVASKAFDNINFQYDYTTLGQIKQEVK